jgi:hypothetical protein
MWHFCVKTCVVKRVFWYWTFLLAILNETKHQMMWNSIIYQIVVVVSLKLLSKKINQRRYWSILFSFYLKSWKAELNLKQKYFVSNKVMIFWYTWEITLQYIWHLYLIQIFKLERTTHVGIEVSCQYLILLFFFSRTCWNRGHNMYHYWKTWIEEF